MGIFSIVAKVLTLAGALGLFLYGMKLMSEALQKVAGDQMREILSRMTAKKIKGVFTGFFVTTVIQSSSATTVMIVSFVNAGLLSLTGAVSIIMGANIGTTVTGWLVALLGFKIKMSILALPLIGISLPFLFSSKSKNKSIGELIIGFAILFIGLQFLKESIPDIKGNPDLFNFLGDFVNHGFLSTLFFLFVGTVLTIVIQSSSATMALTLVLVHNGIINFEMGAAMVLGENIGTTITANLAALIANTSAKRAARAHLLFNLIGVIWMLLVFNSFVKGIDMLIHHFEGFSVLNVDINNLTEAQYGEVKSTRKFALTIFHTIFNIINTGVLVWFIPQIVRLVEKMVPEREDEDEEFRLQYIPSGMVSTAEISLTQAKNEISIFGKRTSKMFSFIPSLIDEKKEKDFVKQLKRIDKYEDICDRMEIEIAKFLTKVSEGRMSKHGAKDVRKMLDIIDNLESIADTTFQISMAVKNKNQKSLNFAPELRNNLDNMFKIVTEAFDIMNSNLEKTFDEVDLTLANDYENKINELRNTLRQDHMDNVGKDDYPFEVGMLYNQIVMLFEKTGDYIINVTEAITGKNYK